MTTAVLQSSLFDLADDIEVGALTGVTREVLGRGAWVDVLPGWVSGAEPLFDALVDHVPWRGEQRQMYERIVDVPRLLSFYNESDRLPHPALNQALAQLNQHYGSE